MVRLLCPGLRALPVVAALTAGLAWAVPAAPLLRCVLAASGDVIHLEARPVADPYPVAAVPVGRSFRFKAVLLADGAAPPVAKLSTYVYTPRQYVLAHQATWVAPTPGSPAAPLGEQRVYSPRTGAELRYRCDWEVAP
ncbi:MAG: hypothetical protein N2256_06510 [Tepidimonas ignava]|nr:hypothetical protein [Tepidimonas ignava]